VTQSSFGGNALSPIPLTCALRKSDTADAAAVSPYPLQVATLDARTFVYVGFARALVRNTPIKEQPQARSTTIRHIRCRPI